ncbi:MAG: DEAD/DEAH box helicase family protein [Halobacteriota archaeon]|nr:DEAD/DEAH box helicase family protein [Halobacteriota archaeon]
MIKITIANPLECRVARKHAKHLKPAISFPAEFWRQTFKGRERIQYEKTCWIHKGKDEFTFYRGHLPRVLKHLKDKKFLIKLIKEDTITPEINVKFKPDLGKYEERDYQIDMLKSAVNAKRGIIVAPTGTGKTIMQIGILSIFKDYPTLILAHTIDIVQQTTDKLLAEGYDVEMLGGGQTFAGAFTSQVVVSTVQSFKKVPQDQRAFAVIMVDETHHVSKFDGTYGQVLSSMLAPVRLGFTATMYDEKTEACFAATGLLGPVIKKMTIHEAAGKKILAKPVIRFIRVPKNDRIRRIRKYDQVIQEGVVDNRIRNGLITEKAMKEYQKGEVILIFVNHIEHGENLQTIFEYAYNIEVPFVQGSMKGKDRLRVKKGLESKTIRMAIATVTWKEGIDIPSITVVINAAGGKSEIGVLQSIGRGLRRKGDKTQVTIYDVFDQSNSFLIDHFGERLSLYMENNWL